MYRRNGFICSLPCNYPMTFARPTPQEPVDTRFATPEESALRKKWNSNPASYVKPPAPKPDERRKAGLLFSGLTDTSLGYVLVCNGKIISCNGGGADELLNHDPDPIRRGTLTTKSKPGFHVYYKHDAYWYGVPHHFDNLTDALPYLQGGNRVIVEYQSTQK